MALLLALVSAARAQTNPAVPTGAPLAKWTVTNSVPTTNEITFAEFLNEVAEANLPYAAEFCPQQFPSPKLPSPPQKNSKIQHCS